MESTKKGQVSGRVSSLVWAIIAAVVSIVCLFILAEAGFVSLFGEMIAKPLSFVVYGILLTISSFLICTHNPKSVWYVLLVLNLFNIMTIIGEYRTIIGTLGLYTAIIIVCTLFFGFWCAKKGKDKLKISATHIHA